MAIILNCRLLQIGKALRKEYKNAKNIKIISKNILINKSKAAALKNNVAELVCAFLATRI